MMSKYPSVFNILESINHLWGLGASAILCANLLMPTLDFLSHFNNEMCTVLLGSANCWTVQGRAGHTLSTGGPRAAAGLIDTEIRGSTSLDRDMHRRVSHPSFLSKRWHGQAKPRWVSGVLFPALSSRVRVTSHPVFNANQRESVPYWH